MPHSLQACSAPSKQMPGSNPKGDRSSIASISASSTISIPSYEPSASKPRDFNLKREQNPRYRQHNGLNNAQRERLHASPQVAFNIHLIRPTPTGALPMRRIFEDQRGDQLEQFDLWKYGYDARKRPWYSDTMQADRLLISSPYISFSIATPVITVSAPLRGTARGVIAADLKLDNFGDFVEAQRPGKRGIALMFDYTGALIAHPELKQFALGREMRGSMILLAAQDDFVPEIQKSHFIATIFALISGAAFIPGVWFFGSRMSRSLKEITVEAGKLQTMAAPNPLPVASYIKEIHELGITMNLAQRAAWSFARFVPKEIVRGLLDKSISTDLGGVRQEITIVFTDVRGFTTIAESADPDTLMHQTSRYFTALTEAFLAEGGTVDKYIGDAVMVFWNAPHP